jgi:phosphopantethiene--protein transferase domain
LNFEFILSQNVKQLLTIILEVYVMIYGNGVDIVEIKRFKEILERNPRFLTRNFSDDENQLFKEKQMKVETIAAGFAAKEAISKAFGTGIRGFNLIDIVVLRNEMGKPIVVLEGNAKTIAESLGITAIELSISHSKDYAVAFAIALSL